MLTRLHDAKKRKEGAELLQKQAQAEALARAERAKLEKIKA